LMPNTVVICIDAVIFGLTLLWLRKALERSPAKYQREKLAPSLAQRFKRSQVDVGRYLDGRSVDELNADELCLLGKVLTPTQRSL
jgi:hypothetical protein